MKIIVDLDNDTKDLKVFIGEAENLKLSEKMACFTTIISELIYEGYESLLKDEDITDDLKKMNIGRALATVYVDARAKMVSLGMSRQEIEDRADHYMMFRMLEKVGD